jgi:mono/diheme cytochrome c family protein
MAKIRAFLLSSRGWVSIGLFGLAAQLSSSQAFAAPGTSEGDAFFETKIRPLLVDRCIACHGPEKQKNGLRLDSKAGWQTGGEHGPAITPGKPDESLLIKAIRYEDKDLQMPPAAKGGKLESAQIAALVQWIKMGAPDPRLPEGTAPPAVAKAKSWWSFQPLRKPRVPLSGAGSPIDAFVDEKITAAGPQKAPAADRRILLRRVTFDLTGLPPTPAEMAAFLEDCSADAFERVVDRLLASPAYGERWARHWLDVARYADYDDADPNARVASCEPLEAWRYRDWVVDSLNRDLPFDRFIVHQIAGDLLPNPTGEAIYPAGLIATCFLLNGVWDRGDADKEKMVSDMVDDQIDTIGKAFLGLTFGCARCHDHKFDPISNRDYYALAGIFYSTHFMESLGTKGGEITLKRVPLVSPPTAAHRDGQVLLLEAIKAKLAALDKLSPPLAANHPERQALAKERDRLQAELPPAYPVVLTVQEGGMPGGLFPNIQDVPVHIRGSYTRLGDVVPRAMPSFFAGETQPRIAQGSGRRELAAWIASAKNPLTARVIVNRIWQWHFGEGLVRTPNNFGLNSEPPSHPGLLDWLAAQFIEDGWSLKQLHRRILCSEAYQRSSFVPREQAALDPENRWLARFSARRLEAEEIRDAMLSVCGALDLMSGGPAGADVSTRRRSLYVQTARWDRSSFAMLFDAANPDASVEKRTLSTVAPQALFMLNHPFVQAQAARLAQRLLGEAQGDESARIMWAYELLFDRSASAEELQLCQHLIAISGGPANEASWRDLAHVLLSSNEFIYVD